MELKRVIGKDNKQAMEEVVRLYGPEALVVSSNKVQDKFEMIVAIDLKADALLLDVPDHALEDENPQPVRAKLRNMPAFNDVLHGSSSPQTTNRDSVRADEIVDLFKSEIQILKQEMQETRKASAWHMQMAQPKDLSLWQQGLVEHAIPNRLKTLLIDSLAGTQNPDQAEEQLHSVLKEGLTQASEDPCELEGLHAFLGPTGSGKTTLIGKLARMASDRWGAERVAVISFSDQKLGAWNQIQLMASQWGIECFRATSTEMLQTILSEANSFNCVLIDTGGVAISSTHKKIQEYAPEALLHLVVGSEISRSSVNRLLQDGMVWDSINVSKLDESTDSWVLLDALLQSPDLQMWLHSNGGSFADPAISLEIGEFVSNILQTIELPEADRISNESTPMEGRQTPNSVTTLDYLTDLRAHQSDRTGGSRSSIKESALNG
jgi:flagellar biosynthesis GTPase FlhF|tara:strand:- start:302 stop:1606 length:1305 start_codon:yes stop_codon:yes gene_type:complete